MKNLEPCTKIQQLTEVISRDLWTGGDGEDVVPCTCQSTPLSS